MNPHLGKSELPGEAVVWKQDGEEVTAVKDGTSYFLQAQGAPARRIFAVDDEAVKRGGYAVVEAKLVERDGGVEAIGGGDVDFGTVQSTKLYWRTMRQPPGSTGMLRLRKTGCTGLCPEVRVHYRWVKQ